VKSPIPVSFRRSEARRNLVFRPESRFLVRRGGLEMTELSFYTVWACANADEDERTNSICVYVINDIIHLMKLEEKPLIWLAGEIKSPPFSASARIEADYLLRFLQNGATLSLPHSQPMSVIASRCHEFRILTLRNHGASSIDWTRTQ
jgi:hypothetical protein